MRHKSPLRYPGGKAALAPFVRELIRANELADGTYVEPYAGGASVALSLLLGEHVSRVVINDIDRGVYAFWRSVLKEPDRLCHRVRKARLTPEEWQRQRGIYLRGDRRDPVALGFATFYLNRTNRSGIIESGGMIGGRAQKGKWRLDARYDAEELAQRIQTIAAYRSRIVLRNWDAAALVARYDANMDGRGLFYLDPPYFVKGRRRLYANFYAPEDHLVVAAAVRKLRHAWIVSYDDVPEIRTMYKGFKALAYGLRYTASERRRGREAMFFSPRLEVPRWLVRGPERLVS